MERAGKRARVESNYDGWLEWFERVFRARFRGSFDVDVLRARRGEQLSFLTDGFLNRYGNDLRSHLLPLIHRILYEEMTVVVKSRVSLREYMKYASWKRPLVWDAYKAMRLWGLRRDLAWMVMERLNAVYLPEDGFIIFATQEALELCPSMETWTYHAKHFDHCDARTYSWAQELAKYILEAVKTGKPLDFVY